MRTRTNLLGVFAVTALFAVLAGCATFGILQHIRKHRAEAEFKAPPETVYEATMLMLERNYFKIDQADPQAGHIRTKKKVYPVYRRYDLPVWTVKLDTLIEPRGEGQSVVKLVLEARVQTRDVLEMIYTDRPETLIKALAEEYLENIKKLVEDELGTK